MLMVAASVLGIAAVRAHAQTPAAGAPSARVLLDGYVSEAMRANLAIAQQTAATRRADATIREANGRFLP